MRVSGQHGRITSKRKSYKQTNRRARADDAEVIDKDDPSDDDEEGFESRLARLRREIAEVKGESERRRTQSQGVPDREPEVDTDDLDSLSQVLDGIQSSSRQGGSGAATRLVQRMNTTSGGKAVSPNGVATEAVQQPQAELTYTLSYAPTYSKDHTLAKVADFDARLALLETILGADTISIPTQDRPYAKAILPTLDALHRQISVLSNSSDSSLDSTSRRVRQLTQDAEKLTEARKSAKAAQDALSGSESPTQQPNGANDLAASQSIEDSEQVSKINALYGTLPTIESLSPLLPSLLDRLRSLRLVHADAANASQSLAKAESRQEAMAEDLRNWREGLQKVEEMLKQNEQTMNGNMSTVEGWVKELEERVQKLAH